MSTRISKPKAKWFEWFFENLTFNYVMTMLSSTHYFKQDIILMSLVCVPADVDLVQVEVLHPSQLHLSLVPWRGAGGNLLLLLLIWHVFTGDGFQCHRSANSKNKCQIGFRSFITLLPTSDKITSIQTSLHTQWFICTSIRKKILTETYNKSFLIRDNQNFICAATWKHRFEQGFIIRSVRSKVRYFIFLLNVKKRKVSHKFRNC